MAIGDDELEIRRTYQLPFAPAQVYAAWVSSDTVVAPATAMDIDPVVGGHYRLVMEAPDFSSRNEGRFLAVDPGRHIRYSWEWNNDGEITEIDVTFSTSSVDDKVGTEIVLLHSGFLKRESLDMHASGWDSYIEGFTAHMKRLVSPDQG